MAKRFPFIVIMMVVSSIAFGQTTKARAEQAKSDPRTTENAAKADVKVVDNKTVTDKATLKTVFAKKRKMNARKRKSPQVK